MSKQFAEFRMGDLFTVENGKKHPVKDRIDGDMPLVSTSSLCRGISQYITVPNEKGFKTHKNILTIAYSGSVGETFYHPYEVFVGETVMALMLKEEFGTLNNLRGQYLQTVIRKKMNRYSYSSKVKMSDVRNILTITLPVTDDSAGTDSPEPDWEYMENYIKGIEEEYLDSVVKYNKRNGEILDALHPDYHGSAPEAYDYAEFRVGDILEFRKGKRVTKGDQIKGNIPYVTAATENNGIDSWIGNAIFTQENVITVNFFGKCFYHPYEVAYKDGTYGAKIRDQKFQLREHYLYLTSALEKATENIGSYSKMLTDTIAVDLAITLPITPGGEPDWGFMEDYIDYIAGGGRNRIARYVQHKKSASSGS